MLNIALSSQTALAADSLEASAILSSESEWNRYSQLASPAQQRRFLACRTLIRQQLTDIYGAAAQNWPISANAGQAPKLLEHSDIFISLSHSREWIACAMSSAPVGIDIEMLRDHANPEEKLGIFGHLAEVETIKQLPAQRQSEYMLECWTSKEAWLKKQGIGLDFNAMQRLTRQHVQPQHADLAILTLPAASLIMSIAYTVAENDAENIMTGLALAEKPDFYLMSRSP